MGVQKRRARGVVERSGARLLCPDAVEQHGVGRFGVGHLHDVSGRCENGRNTLPNCGRREICGLLDNISDSRLDGEDEAEVAAAQSAHGDRRRSKRQDVNDQARRNSIRMIGVKGSERDSVITVGYPGVEKTQVARISQDRAIAKGPADPTRSTADLA